LNELEAAKGCVARDVCARVAAEMRARSFYIAAATAAFVGMDELEHSLGAYDGSKVRLSCCMGATFTAVCAAVANGTDFTRQAILAGIDVAQCDVAVTVLL
jgi:hypothetical protein